MKNISITNRTKINRLPKRASYDINVINNILDEAFVCHVGFKIDDQVYIIPTAYGRKDNLIFIHGSKNSRMLKSFSSGDDISISVTLVDGLVLARSAFHHSVNYRSVVIFGKPEEILSKGEKTYALEIIMEHIIAGRWNEVRKPNEKELNATSVFSLKIDEASAKIRTGPSVDDEEDLNLNVWSGILPLKVIAEEPVPSLEFKENISLPDYIKHYRRKHEK
ncbi:MAG: pyridoxamine 5'-phosphate oxidase family protein [Bacteroidetes bacterium]|nr:pyridoxamine 5'-phosphate oxidase family protein [Bacteroidota bacterium]